MSKKNPSCPFEHSALAWTTTPVEYDCRAQFGGYPCAAVMVGTAGILVYEDYNGTNRKIVANECTKGHPIWIQAKRLLASGTVDGGATTTTAQDVRVFW